MNELNPHSPRDRVRGAFLGCAVGDALGRVFEGASARDLAAFGAVEARAAGAGPWAYTDDTEMMLGVAESLLACGRVDPGHLVRTLAAGFDPARGYGRGTRRVLEAVARGVDWREATRDTWAEGSRGNGAAVRVVALACAYCNEPEALVAAVDASASATHAHPVARIGSLVHALALAEAIRSPAAASPDPVALVRRVSYALPTDDASFRVRLACVAELCADGASVMQAASVLGNGVSADESVPLALFAFLRHMPRPDEAVVAVIRAGGDTDSAAAMTGALAGALSGACALPPSWISNVEQGARVSALADAVFARWSRGEGTGAGGV